jgi:hypothetical protein
MIGGVGLFETIKDTWEFSRIREPTSVPEFL